MISTRSRSSISMAILTVLVLSLLYTAVEASPSKIRAPVEANMLAKRAAPVYSGCYSSSTNLKESATYTWQSSGWCQGNCLKNNSGVIGLTNGNDCWCGTSVPPASSKVDDSKCSSICDGYDIEKCGANGYWTVYTIGVENVVNNALSSSSTTSSSNRVVTSVAPNETIVVTLSTTAQPKKSGTNTAGIAAGVVVGIVAFAALCGGLFFFFRRRRQRAADEEYRRNNQMSEFMRGANEIKPPPSAYSSTSDSRLDPVSGRRDSSGSLADEQDYSRRILRVANPDR